MTATIHKRVIKDIQDGMKNLKNEFGIYISPEETDIYKVHFILPGPEDTPFEGGLYHGMIRLNTNHPLGAPNIHMITPSGRFASEPYPIPNGSRGICTTATAFHPDTWTPMNNIETVLKGFISLMCDPYDGGIGGVKSTNEQMKKLAKESINQLKSDIAVKNFFPELHESLVDGTYKPIKLIELSKSYIKPNNKKIENKKTESEEISVRKKISKIKKIISESESESESDSDIINVSDSEEDENDIAKLQNKTKTIDNKRRQKNKQDGKKIDQDSDSEQETKKKTQTKSKKKQIKKINNYSGSDSSESDQDQPIKSKTKRTNGKISNKDTNNRTKKK
jgi:ubiquitin-protein ligase